MPIYEYRCSACGFQKEYIQKFSDTILTMCPECKEPAFVKLLSAAGFQLKGSGWYQTDFKNPPSKPKSPDKTAEKAEAKTDSAEKSAPKTPATSAPEKKDKEVST